MSENLVVNGVTYNGVDSISMTNENGERVQYYADAVRYVEQDLTDKQKAQARENIGVEKYLTEELAKRGQLTPEYANSIEECTDTTKMYVLPDGFIYAYMLTEVESAPSYTNKLPLAVVSGGGAIYNGTGYKNGYRLNSSATEKQQDGCGHTGFISAKQGDIIRIKNIPACTQGYGYLHYFNANYEHAHYVALTNQFVEDANGISSFTIPVHTDNAAVAKIRLSYGTMSADSIITINEEITEGGGTTTGYAWVNTGLAFVPADYESRIIELENQVSSLGKDLENAMETTPDLMYISPNGDDENDGLSVDTPKKTVKACVKVGATRISAERGIYKEFFHLFNVKKLEIFPTDNDQTYSSSAEWSPIVFDTSDSIEISSLETYSSIRKVAYSNSENTQFDKVFIKKSLTPIANSYGERYNSTVWLLSSDEKTVCIKLKPVLTVAECETETNTFTYVDGYIYINADMTGVEKIIVPTNWGTGIHIQNAQKVVLREVEVRFSGTYNIHILNCPHFELYKCSARFTSYASGIDIDNANGILTACYATKNFDGFGVSGYGHTTFVDCVSEFNFDDGVSHHDGTEGTFIGGRYEGNGKGGNTPAYGAKVNIYGGIYKNNGMWGIGYLYSSGLEPASGITQGAVMVSNPIGLRVDANCLVTAISCLYKDNTEDKDSNGILTEY